MMSSVPNAMMNIEVLNAYEAKKIVTACPHCFNTLKNEYPNWREI
jgi:Fe-S oxidoreductase